MAMATAAAVFEYHLTVYKRSWRSTLFDSLATPILLLLGIGLSVGGLVERTGALGVPYVQFLGPALLVSASLQLAIQDSGPAVLSDFKWERTYFGIAAAPPTPSDIVLGGLAYLALRVLISSSAFLLVMLPFGVARSPWAALLPLLAVLLAAAGALPMFAFAASVESPNVMGVALRLAILPMTLFSGVFYPLEVLPVAIQAVAYVLPLSHGVVLARALAEGALDEPGLVVHLLALLLWCAAGYLLARARFVARLTV